MDDLISEFITETSESLQILDSELVKLEQNPGDEKILGNIFRLVHTVKGTCGFLGLPRLESVAHAGENVLGKIRDKLIAVSPEAISLVLASLDCIKTIVEYLTSHGEEPAGDDAALIATLNAFAESNGASTGAAAQVKQAEPVVQATQAVSIPEAAPAPPQPHAPAQQPAAEMKDPEGAAGASGAVQSIRVNLDVLETLMQMVGELVLTRNQLLQIVRTRNDHVLATPLQRLSHITSELQEGIMKTRMQPIGNAWSKFPRLIRDLSHDLGKKIDLRMVGAETELDRQLLEMIKDPLTHMVRNSADHGLEMPADRRAAGKPETGTVTLSAFHQGGHIIIEIADDGRGLNIERIKNKAVGNRLVSEADLKTLSDQQIMQFIFRPGFSTAEKVTSVSGRGVGMDVVRTNIEKIGGTVELSSTEGKGSTFTIKIPLTLAIVSVLIVEAGGERLALPQINVQELVQAGRGSGHSIERIHCALVLRLRGELLPLVSLANVLGMSDAGISENETAFIAVCKVGACSFGLIVDRIFDTEEIVVKPTSEMIKSIPLYSGNTILGDGSVIMILDPNGLARAMGVREITGGGDAMSDLRQAAQVENLVKFLLFKAGDGAPKAVPLELISRLEEIDMKTQERSGEHAVVQYRGDLMRLRMLGEALPLPQEGKREVIVFAYDGKTLGLVVDEISDIVSAIYDVKLPATAEGSLGSMVIEGKTTEIIDVAHLLRGIVGMGDVAGALPDPGRQPRLLLVEDSPFFRNLTVPFLAAAGYKVTAADNGRDALVKLDSLPAFDVIITDIEMPEMDGFAFAQQCRNNPKLSHIPVFAFSSTRNDQNVERGRLTGLRGFVLKTDRAQLLRMIAAVLKDERETV